MSQHLSQHSPQKSASLFSDAKAGFIISLIALPLCLGIATASGFPPFAGLITAIVGGLCVSWLGSSQFTIKGPAAGLIVIALGSVLELGQGDMTLGYHQALAVGVGAGVLQMLFAVSRAAGLGIAMSKTVVHGMLAAIGIIIVAKQVHVALGVIPNGKDPLSLLMEIPTSFMHADFAISLVGFVSLCILLWWPKLGNTALKAIPAPLVVLLFAIPSTLYFGLNHSGSINLLSVASKTGPEFMVQLPDSLLDGIAFPDFSAFFTLTSLKYVMMFALVGTIESTLSVVAVDAIKDYQYPSDLNKDLLAVSIGNIFVAFLGGLPMISEIVRSKANIDAGATSHKANFFHGAFLLLYVAFFSALIELIPLTALATMLVVTGLRLASYKEFTHAKALGNDQVFLFVLTIVVTLTTDLLLGVAVGLVAKVVLHFFRGVNPLSLFTSKFHLEKVDSEWVIRVEGNAAFVSLLKLKASINEIPEQNASVVIDVRQAQLVDHTFLSGIDVVFSSRPDLKRRIEGLNVLSPASAHPLATHVKKG